MHELPIIKNLFDICMKHATAKDATKIVAVTLKIGNATDLVDEWIQRYFDFCTKDTIAEGCKLKIERVPFVVKCKKCAEEITVNLREQRNVECPKCQAKEFAYVSGREFSVESMEILHGRDTTD